MGRPGERLVSPGDRSNHYHLHRNGDESSSPRGLLRKSRIANSPGERATSSSVRSGWHGGTLAGGGASRLLQRRSPAGCSRSRRRFGLEEIKDIRAELRFVVGPVAVNFPRRPGQRADRSRYTTGERPHERRRGDGKVRSGRSWRPDRRESGSRPRAPSSGKARSTSNADLQVDFRSPDIRRGFAPDSAGPAREGKPRPCRTLSGSPWRDPVAGRDSERTAVVWAGRETTSTM